MSIFLNYQVIDPIEPEAPLDWVDKVDNALQKVGCRYPGARIPSIAHLSLHPIQYQLGDYRLVGKFHF